MKNKLIRIKRARRIAQKLKKLFPAGKIALRHHNHWELLVAVMLSAQCTDKKVNEVTAKLFKKYRTLKDYVLAKPKEFEQDIKSTGFYKNKTKHILSAAKIVQAQFQGKIPRTMEQLLSLPGVARKTANVVLGNAFHKIEGIAVDTHVRRFALKFNLTDYKDPGKIEKDLVRLFPKKDWIFISNALIAYGRQICPARKHECVSHPLTKLYPQAAARWPKSK